MNILESIKGKVIVSVQAMPGEPLYKEECMKAMMASVVNGGASALRVAGVRDIKNAKEFGLPVIGITKPDKLPDNWLDVVYISATKDDIIKIIWIIRRNDNGIRRKRRIRRLRRRIDATADETGSKNAGRNTGG